MDVVEGHLALEASRMNDTDEDGLTAMHHAARYNRVNVLNRLTEAGGGRSNLIVIGTFLGIC